MNYYSKLLVFVLVIQSCAITKGSENTNVVEAVKMQQAVLDDDLFYKIIKEMDYENSIDWSNGRLDYVNPEELSNYSNNGSWLIDQYKTVGVYNIDEVFLWSKWNPFSSTTAVTNKCIKSTKLNKHNLDRTKYSILNTLIHERVHSFCVIHPSQQSKGQECDPSYIVGDLAQMLALYRDGKDLSAFENELCDGLRSKLLKYNILTK
ncbi:hypothetical protein [Winogradskyella bathintestinalis]|uniref:SprT-like domain-containing protein n=1 Tax=Winogradskyella bathintestinalis TaxID=3035208 RepID=A0ABT7ZVR6_9FLAO|nr:hypothetical protein [Winogradskyella bathintestinalis]MDN3493078.1 hypothetical protein [Winogradskyella bathintestinalis]